MFPLIRKIRFCLSGRRDLNSGLPAPKAGALTGLRYAPKFANLNITDLPSKIKIFLPPVPAHAAVFLVTSNLWRQVVGVQQPGFGHLAA